MQAVERSTFLTEQDGKLTALSWEVLTPKTDFVSDVRSPRARVELGPGRLLVLEAAEGTVEHPGNDFQRGNFRGGTVATFHRLDDPQAAVSDATAVLRLLLDGPTTFDRELGRLSTAGPVRVTGPRVDLVGEGLELDFSRAEEEIKKLVLDNTFSLRLRRDEAVDPAGPAPGVASRGPSASVAETGDGPRISDDAGGGEAAAVDAVTVYRVEASGSVDIRSDTGARLDRRDAAAFLRSSGGDSRRRARPPPRRPRLDSADRRPSTPKIPTVRGDEVAAVPAEPEGSGSLFRPGPGTLELAWTGPLRLRPATADEGPPEVRAPGFADAHLQLGGTEAAPATAASGTASIAAVRLAYGTATGRLVAEGEPGVPVVAEDPAAGRLTARLVEAEPDAGTAVATGPGELRAVDPAAGEAAAEDALRVSFQEAMRLAFDPARGGDDPQDVVLREAVFTGSVSALVAAAEGDADTGGSASPLGSGGGPLTLDASRLTLTFAPPAATARREAPARHPSRCSPRAASPLPAHPLKPEPSRSGRSTARTSSSPSPPPRPTPRRLRSPASRPAAACSSRPPARRRVPARSASTPTASSPRRSSTGWSCTATTRSRRPPSAAVSCSPAAPLLPRSWASV